MKIGIGSKCLFSGSYDTQFKPEHSSYFSFDLSCPDTVSVVVCACLLVWAVTDGAAHESPINAICALTKRQYGGVCQIGVHC